MRCSPQPLSQQFVQRSCFGAPLDCEVTLFLQSLMHVCFPAWISTCFPQSRKAHVVYFAPLSALEAWRHPQVIALLRMLQTRPPSVPSSQLTDGAAVLLVRPTLHTAKAKKRTVVQSVWALFLPSSLTFLLPQFVLALSPQNPESGSGTLV